LLGKDIQRAQLTELEFFGAHAIHKENERGFTYKLGKKIAPTHKGGNGNKPAKVQGKELSYS